MKHIKRFIFSLLIMGSTIARGQVSIQFIPEVYGRSLDGLMHANILNTSQSFNARLNITVTENKSGQIISLQTAPFTINPGNNIIPQSAAGAAKIQFGGSAVAGFIKKNGYFPEGGYEYNFKIISAITDNQQIITDQVFYQDVTPVAPLDLIEPYNQDEICEKRPQLTWQPLIPNLNGTLYALVLAEVKNNQSPAEALNYNLPLINQKGIFSNILLYPPNAKELQEGKKYAWQVTAYKDQTIINRSEVWSFKINCRDSISSIKEIDNGYRDIEDLVKGNYYVANGSIKFAMVNPYQEQALKYDIICINNAGKKIRHLPKIKLSRGQNKIRMDLSHNYSFDDNYSYVLRIQMPNGSQKNLRFIYKETE